MRNIYKLFLTFIVFDACHGTSQTKELPTVADDEWVISYKTIQAHIYSKSSLLDTTYSTEFIYAQGALVDTEKSITLRKYDSKNNLISEKTFRLSTSSPLQLKSETVRKYDDRNNLIYIMSKSEGVNYDRQQTEYNDKNQEIKSVAISETQGEFFERIDTNKKSSFDTSIITYSYDDKGNLIKTLTNNSAGEIKNIRTNVYSGSEKVFTYELNRDGDTTITFTYSKDGDLSKEIASIKEGGKEAGSLATWLMSDKAIRVIARSQQFQIKNKVEIKYNDNGDEIESVSYK